METIAKTAEDKIRRGIINLQKPHPFFAYLLMMMKPVKMDEHQPMQTMGVDAKGNLHYAKEFSEKLTEEQMLGVLCHETLHVALLHMTRRGNRNPEIANIAQDVTVNMLVRKAGLELTKDSVPVDIHRDTSRFPLGQTMIEINDVSKKAWEEIYAEILEQLDDNGQPQSSANGARAGGLGFDNHMADGDDGEPMSPQEKQKQEQRWQHAVAEAAHYAKQQGHLPAGMERLIDDLLKPKVVWRAMLLKYLRPYLSPVDWTYQKPNKKSQVLDVFLPNTLKEHCEIEVVVDTSGSIAKKELTEFLSEIVNIAQSMNHVKMTVHFVDTEVNCSYTVDNGDIPKILAMKPEGGGGTSMEVGLDYVKEHNREVPVVIVFTDGYDSWRKQRKDYPFDVIWVINQGGISEAQMKKIPYGVCIKMD